MGLVQLIDNQELQGQSIQNVYHYEYAGVSLSTNDLQELIAEFVGNVMNVIRSCQSTGLFHNSVYVKDLDGTAEYLGGFTPPQFGTQAGAFLPRFNCWTFTYGRATTTTRNGRKAIAGVAELNQVNGLPETAFNANLDAAAAGMGMTLITPIGGVLFVPVIVRKPGQVGQVINNISEVSFTRQSTQNSRK